MATPPPFELFWALVRKLFRRHPRGQPQLQKATKSVLKSSQKLQKMTSKAYSNRQISCSDWHPQVHQGHKHAHANRGRGGQYEDTPKAVAASKNQAIGKQTDRQTTTRQQQIKKTKNTEKVQRPHHVRSTGAAVYRLACSIRRAGPWRWA